MTEEERERVISEKVIGITLEKITDMTREEAIARIQEHMIAHKMKEPRAILISKALDMAVNALKQEPCEDAISRKAVLELINGYGVRMDGNKTYEVVCNGLVRATKIALCDAIKNMPPVTPTREHGEWIERIDRDDYNDYENIWYECTNCHGDADRPFNFCPNCGADMRGEWTDEVIEKQGNKLIECITTEAYKIARGNIDKARKIMAGKISEEEEKQLIFGADMRKEQNNV